MRVLCCYEPSHQICKNKHNKWHVYGSGAFSVARQAKRAKPMKIEEIKQMAEQEQQPTPTKRGVGSPKAKLYYVYMCS